MCLLKVNQSNLTSAIYFVPGHVGQCFISGHSCDGAQLLGSLLVMMPTVNLDTALLVVYLYPALAFIDHPIQGDCH